MRDYPYTCPLCGADCGITGSYGLRVVAQHLRGEGTPCPASGGTRRRARVFAAHVRDCPTGDRASCRLCAELGCAPEPRRDAGPELATCPACGLRGVPVFAGKLAAHGWRGCDHRELSPVPFAAPDRARGEGPE